MTEISVVYVELTPAKRRALDLLAAANREGHSVRPSNRTSVIGWTIRGQEAWWLVGQGLAEYVQARTRIGTRVQITDRGRQL